MIASLYREPVMLEFAYLVLFLALSAIFTWWRVANYRRMYDRF